MKTFTTLSLAWAILLMRDSAGQQRSWQDVSNNSAHGLSVLVLKATSNTHLGEPPHPIRWIVSLNRLRTDAAFEPWISTLLHGLLRLLPLPPHLSLLPAEGLPTPRVTVLPATREDLLNECDPFLSDSRYHMFELTINERITADDWYQEVRHLVFRCIDDLAYVLI